MCVTFLQPVRAPSRPLAISGGIPLLSGCRVILACCSGLARLLLLSSLSPSPFVVVPPFLGLRKYSAAYSRRMLVCVHALLYICEASQSRIGRRLSVSLQSMFYGRSRCYTLIATHLLDYCKKKKKMSPSTEALYSACISWRLIVSMSSIPESV